MYRLCPISYSTPLGSSKYSAEGLKLLSNRLDSLSDLPFDSEGLRFEAVKRAHKMSIQGVQVKLSAKLNVAQKTFEVVDKYGTYILKPQNNLYAELPENEDLSMRLAKSVGIEVPLHGMVYTADGRLCYFIKRFDRYGHNKKRCLEDFAQLAGLGRDEKYNFTMERIVKIIDQYCTFPMIEKKKLFLRTLFNYVIGNEDMHTKNFSLITRNEKIELSPAYDFLNTTLAMGHAKEEIALPLNGRKNKLTREDLIDYFAYERLGLNEKVVGKILRIIKNAQPEWKELINKSFLSDKMKEEYAGLVNIRKKTVGL